MRPTPTIGSRRAVKEVGAPNWAGGNIKDVEATDKTTAVSGVTAKARVAGPTAMMDIAAGIGVNMGAKGIHPTPTTQVWNETEVRL